MINITPRSSENTSKIPMRSDRFFAVNAYWFFSTREGADIGPFESKNDALTGLNTFIEFINVAPRDTKDRFLAKYLSLQ